jgi:ribosomal protein S18 acetylase RimI-like enzyme
MDTARAIRKEDVPSFLECQRAVWKSLEGTLPTVIIDENLEGLSDPTRSSKVERGLEDTSAIILVMESKGVVSGVALGRVDKGVSWLGFIGVDPSQRGKGFGRMLLQKFISESEKRGAHKISLYTSPVLQSAIALYVESGFIPEGYLRKHSYQMDMIVYSKHLE